MRVRDWFPSVRSPGRIGTWLLVISCAAEPTATSSKLHAADVWSASPTAPRRGKATTHSADAGVPPDDGVSQQAPAAITEPTLEPPPTETTWDPGVANLNPSDDEVVGPPDAIPDCHDRLRAAGVTFRSASLPIVRRRGFVCGAHQAVEYQDGPEHIRFRPHPVVTCQLALALAHFEGVINRTASELLGARVTSVTQGGTYSCRAMARFRLVSEHSYGNAIDLYAFGLSDGRTVSVLKHFGSPSSPATSPESRFLRTLGERLFDENVFSVVVTRFFDELHRDHFHVDMAHYRTDGSRV